MARVAPNSSEMKAEIGTRTAIISRSIASGEVVRRSSPPKRPKTAALKACFMVKICHHAPRCLVPNLHLAWCQIRRFMVPNRHLH